ncbi:MAG: TIGR03560 family F420-dependent LLM class oxidoreductase [Candidatus Bathyarchaeota archaeon]
MPNKFRFGVFLPFYAFRNQKTVPQMFEQLKEIVLGCEKLGYDSVWLDDHLMMGATPILECWTTLSALASVTKKIKLGTMVTCNLFRNPALLAKMAATLDNISNGRIELGIGAGVQKTEHEAYGFLFSSAKERIQRLNEAVEIIKKLWTYKQASYNGRYYKLKDAMCEPKPIQKNHPPIIIGGSGEELTLKVTAQKANRYDWGYLSSIIQYQHKLKVLENHCKKVGRNLDDIEKSCWPAAQIFIRETKYELEKQIPKWKRQGTSIEEFMKTNFVGKPENFIKLIQPYQNLGVTHFMLFFGDLPDLTGLQLFVKKVVHVLNK